MKKLVLSMAIVATGFAAFAQKPSAGNITTEMGLSSVLGAPVAPANLNMPAGMLRGRYFLSDDMAVRGSFGFGMTSTKSIVDDDGLSPVVDKSEQTVSSTMFGIAVGIEKHLAGTSNLSPYIGAEFGLSSMSGSKEVTNFNGASFSKNDKYTESGGGVTTIALNAMVGADYYLTDKVYIGAELGVGLFNMTSTAEKKGKVTTEAVIAQASSATTFGIQAMPMGIVRLGIILF